ncbi:MFS transporter [Paenibacillus fonticola]|uniref:MFS transporter n=1 Tax=Paenibacillus fonticola TaxID=379896 RepID=UPI0003A359DA|nr:MFS transporter [Paenibacillus fonticola]
MRIPSSLIKYNPVGLMTAICMGAFTSHYTAGVVNISLPYLSDVFGADLEHIQWITVSYLLTIAALLPVMGSVGDRLGYRFIHNLGYVLFTISSLLVAFSSNLFMLFAFRVVQAMGAAMFQATNIALVSIHIPKDRRGQALGLVSTVVALGTMAGPIAGGWITEWLHWKWLFLLHVPVMIVASILALRYIPKHNKIKERKVFDIVGMLLFTGGVVSFILGISFMNTWGIGSAKTIWILIASLFAMYVFWLWESRHPVPFISIQLFRSSSVLSGLIISSSSFLLANLVLVGVPFYLSHIVQLSPAAAGYVMLVYPICLAAVGTLAGRLSDRYGSIPFVMIGLGCMGLGFLGGLFIHHYSTLAGIIVILASIGLGMGFVASPNNSLIIEHTPKTLVGAVGGMIALTRNLGMVLGASFGLGMLNHATEITTVSFLPIFGFGLGISAASMFVLRYCWARRHEN